MELCLSILRSHNQRRIKVFVLFNRIQIFYKEWLRQGVLALSEEERLLIFLLFYEEKTVKETAVQLGYSRKTITNRKKAVLQKLREILEKV